MQVNPTERNISVLERIIEYCNQADAALIRFGNSVEDLENDTDFRNALSMCILQIGELTTLLTEDFRDSYTDIPWQDIKKMRNLAVHHYWRFDAQILWETANNDISPLRDYCKKCIDMLKR